MKLKRTVISFLILSSFMTSGLSNAEQTTATVPLDAVDSEQKLDTGIYPAKEDKTAKEIESTVLKSLLDEGFPEKSDFIQNEDKKSDVKLTSDKPKSFPKAPVVQTAKSDSLDLTDMMTKMGVTVLILAGVFLALATLWKFLQGKSGQVFKSKSSDLNIVAQQVIAPKSKILIVEAMGRKFLIGATEANIQLLSDMDFYSTAESQDDLAQTFKSPIRSRTESQNTTQPIEDASRQATAFHAMNEYAQVQATVGHSESRSNVKKSAADRIKNRLKELKKI